MDKYNSKKHHPQPLLKEEGSYAHENQIFSTIQAPLLPKEGIKGWLKKCKIILNFEILTIL
ncbi:MAG: hypothetical protein NZ516_11150, partial [Raineya sp.]|nr:hypothetical protein [Raineya sp.]